MAGFSDYSSRKILDHIVGKTSYTMPTSYVGLYTAAPTDAGGGTEVSGNGYARVATTGTTWNAASGSAPASNSNAAAITFPQSTASWGTLVAWGLFDAATAGNLLVSDYIGPTTATWLPFTCSSASPGVLTSPAHGLANGNSIVVSAEYGGTLPATAGSWAGLLTVAGVTTDTFTAGVNTTGSGDGLWRLVVPLVTGGVATQSFAIGALTITLS